MGKAITSDRALRLMRLMGVYMNNVSFDGVSDDTVEWALQNPKEAGAQFSQFLRNGGKTQIVVKQLFVVWREILVSPTNLKQAIAKLKRSNCSVGDIPKNVMSEPSFQTLSEPKRLKLAKVSVSDLGFTKEPNNEELSERIHEIGELCPPELGPALSKEYQDQPNGETIWLAMKQIADPKGDSYVFCIRRNIHGKGWLGTGMVNSAARWPLDAGIVFVLPE